MAKATIQLPAGYDDRVSDGANITLDVPQGKDDAFYERAVNDYLDARYGPKTPRVPKVKLPELNTYKGMRIVPPANEPALDRFASGVKQGVQGILSTIPGHAGGEVHQLSPEAQAQVHDQSGFHPIQHYKDMVKAMTVQDQIDKQNDPGFAATDLPIVSDIDRLQRGDIAGEAGNLLPSILGEAAMSPKVRAGARGAAQGAMATAPHYSRWSLPGVGGAIIGALTHGNTGFWEGGVLGAGAGALMEQGAGAVKGAMSAADKAPWLPPDVSNILHPPIDPEWAPSVGEQMAGYKTKQTQIPGPMPGRTTTYYMGPEVPPQAPAVPTELPAGRPQLALPAPTGETHVTAPEAAAAQKDMAAQWMPRQVSPLWQDAQRGNRVTNFPPPVSLEDAFAAKHEAPLPPPLAPTTPKSVTPIDIKKPIEVNTEPALTPEQVGLRQVPTVRREAMESQARKVEQPQPKAEQINPPPPPKKSTKDVVTNINSKRKEPPAEMDAKKISKANSEPEVKNEPAPPKEIPEENKAPETKGKTANPYDDIITENQVRDYVNRRTGTRHGDLQNEFGISEDKAKKLLVSLESKGEISRSGLNFVRKAKDEGKFGYKPVQPITKKSKPVTEESPLPKNTSVEDDEESQTGPKSASGGIRPVLSFKQMARNRRILTLQKAEELTGDEEKELFQLIKERDNEQPAKPVEQPAQKEKPNGNTSSQQPIQKDEETKKSTDPDAKNSILHAGPRQISHEEIGQIAESLGVKFTYVARWLEENNYDVEPSKFGGTYGLRPSAKRAVSAAHTLADGDAEKLKKLLTLLGHQGK